MSLPGWLLCAVSAFVGTWLARAYALQARLVDVPGERRSHRVATPRGGGIAIVVVVLAGLGWVAWGSPATRPLVACVAAGMLLVATIGWIDDHRPLPVRLRLAVHAIAGLALAAGLAMQGSSPLMCVFAFALVLVWTNIWNFMDGINGIAASQAAIWGIGLALFASSGPLRMLGAMMAAACMGFLPLNFSRARIFMGDVGSGALGFLVAVEFAWLLSVDGWRGWSSAFVLAPFGVDAALTLGSRMLRGESWWTPHVQHLYQAWARHRGHVPVTLAYAAWSVVGVAGWGLVRSREESVIGASLAGWYTLSTIIWVLYRRGPGSTRVKE